MKNRIQPIIKKTVRSWIQMNQNLPFIKTAKEVKSLIEDGASLRLIDCRTKLGDPSDGRRRYEESHLPNAVYVDLEGDLTGEKGEHGGRHPLPTPEALGEMFSHLGIDQETMVVAYDDEGGAFASRLWWMLSYVGHENVYILNGGFKEWTEHGFPVTKEKPVFTKKDFSVNVQPHMTISKEEVAASLNEAILIDSRELARYQGISEPVDKKAGRIPGAVHGFWKENLDESGMWKDEHRLRERFADLHFDEEIIVYCGSGVTACPNILALKGLGYQNVKLYPGSWSDWITYPDAPIEKEPQS